MAIITISRKIASYGDETAKELAKVLGYKFIDKKMLEQDLIRKGISEDNLKRYDERKPGFWASLSRNRDEYLDYLRETVYGYAKNGNCIFIGRGGFALLEGVPGCYAVRLVASDAIRINRLMQEFDWTEKAARNFMQESDANREGFHKCFFDKAHDNPSHYHLVVNTDFATPEVASDIIQYACLHTISQHEEERGIECVALRLIGQKIVNHIAFTLKLQIYFLDAEVSKDSIIILHGLADSTAYIDQALKVAEEMSEGRKVISQISTVNEYKTYP